MSSRGFYSVIIFQKIEPKELKTYFIQKVTNIDITITPKPISTVTSMLVTNVENLKKLVKGFVIFITLVTIIDI